MYLAKDLWAIYHRKLYVKWGYETFDAYLDKEVGISRDYARRMRRLFSVYVLKFGIRPAELDEIGRSKAQMLLPVVDKKNVKEWLGYAKELPYGELQAKVHAAKYADSDDDDDDTITVTASTDTKTPKKPVRLAASESNKKTTFVKRSFSLPEDSDTLLDEALGEAQRITQSSSQGFNLSCIAQHFLAHRLTSEGKNDGRLHWFMRQMERIYGVRLLEIKTDKAWDLLRETVVENPKHFGITEESADERECNNDEEASS